ncbi:uncharacterized protein LOC128304885 [Anopheles moucheti]|uniref:uncharacterized protein LOC128304885 n=1 Tax=Anopheles moucheti TaxID=186751 RepID=UPI0022F01E71|nr:uncharacterized protein LOC128304885 [Anopheles moucheti]
MFKLLCLCTFLAVVTAFPGGIDDPVYHGAIMVKREAPAAATVATENTESDAATMDRAVDTLDDMDKAETFGFGYRKYIHVYPRYYPRYYYGSYYYPRYHYGHYGHYW